MHEAGGRGGAELISGGVNLFFTPEIKAGRGIFAHITYIIGHHCIRCRLMECHEKT
jgi:hypothetical protein